MSNIENLLDEEGENQAVRDFLMQYSCDRSIAVGAMLAHMNHSGWREAAPAFALEVRPETHLTKSGAQIWIRHLFSLEAERTASPSSASEAGELPKWIDDAKGQDPFTDDLITEIIRLRAASTRTASEPDILREALEICVKALESARIGKYTRDFARKNARDALAICRTTSTDATSRSRAEGGNTKEAALQELTDIAQANNMGYGPAEVDVEAERKECRAHFGDGCFTFSTSADGKPVWAWSRAATTTKPENNT